jgi:phosphoglycolate phosphatase
MLNHRTPEFSPRWRGAPLSAVLLDLDGTLLDTAEDIAKALNRSLSEMHFASLATAEVRNMIGRGAPTLITRAVARLGESVYGSDQAKLLERFDYHYHQLHRLKESHSLVYPGVADGLRELHGLGMRLAVVTNKTHAMAVQLLHQLGLHQWIDVVVGGDSCEHRKPSPEPLLLACIKLQIDRREVIMVGDSTTDVSAARAANIPVICVPYGYNEGRNPRDLPCDAFIDSLTELPQLLLEPALVST